MHTQRPFKSLSHPPRREDITPPTLARKISTVTPSSPRALSAEDLAEEITAQGFKAEPYALVPLAVQQALGDYYGEIVVLTGSLTLFKDLGVKYL